MTQIHIGVIIVGAGAGGNTMSGAGGASVTTTGAASALGFCKVVNTETFQSPAGAPLKAIPRTLQ